MLVEKALWSQLFLVVSSAVSLSRDNGIELAITAPRISNAVDASGVANRGRNTLPTSEENFANNAVLSAPLSSFGNDYGYTISVTFGSQGQRQFPLLVDTGSSRLWVFGSDVHFGQGGKQRYGISKPAESVSEKQWESSYADGCDAKGKTYHDTMRLGNYQIQLNLPVAQHATGFTAMSCSGIIGLGLDDRNWALPSTKYAIDLKPDPEGHPDAGGSIQFGGAFNKYGALTWVPIDKSTRAWIVPVLAYKIGSHGQVRHQSTILHQGLPAHDPDHTLATSRSSQHCALIDSGTTFNLLDDAIILALMSSIPGARFDTGEQLWHLPCVPRAGAPDALWFQIGTTWFNVPYRIGGLLWYDLGDGNCGAAVQSRGDNNCDIFGAFFMHGVYTVFDEDQSRIGFARKW